FANGSVFPVTAASSFASYQMTRFPRSSGNCRALNSQAPSIDKGRASTISTLQARVVLVGEKPLVRPDDALSKRDLRTPTELAHPTRVEKLAHRPVRNRRVVGELAFVSDHLRDELRQFVDRHLESRADIYRQWIVV